jgi:hypothetical protein
MIRLPNHCPHRDRDGLVCMTCAYARIDELSASLEREKAEKEQWRALAEAHRQDSEDVDRYVARLDASREGIEALDKWLNERHNAPTVTTLGMIQEKLRELLRNRP